MRGWPEIIGEVLGELLDLAGVAFIVVVFAIMAGLASEEVLWLRLN